MAASAQAAANELFQTRESTGDVLASQQDATQAQQPTVTYTQLTDEIQSEAVAANTAVVYQHDKCIDCGHSVQQQ